jgi:signal transduction histidine kinase
MMMKQECDAWIRRLNFPQEVERLFQEDYYSRLSTALRATCGLLSVIGIFWAALHFRSTGSTAYFFLAAANLLILRTAFWQRFVEFWQPLVITNLLAIVIALFSVAAREIPLLWVINFIAMVGCRLLRLQFRWMLLLQIAILITGSGAVMVHYKAPGSALFAFVMGASIVSSVPLLLTFNRERFERGQFLATYLLIEERNDERRKREQTESMLHVLSQAIGSIVHDLGNPLTAVQTGAQTLLYFVAHDEKESGAASGKGSPVDKSEVKEFAEIILDGAEMLNYLRLSLIEQTRVLEGKPIPVEPGPASIRRIMEAGARYQKPKFTSGRQVSLIGDDLEVCVDEMKLITVFMNLIGNALKYSDGGVRVTWHMEGQTLIVAVADQGSGGKGLSQFQAEQLFVPFGRLDAHAQIEGTGLGLLSVQKIVEAHGGEIYIEGYTDGTWGSARFSTTRDVKTALPRGLPTQEGPFSTQKSALTEGFLTAFVVACPLNSTRQSSPAQLESSPHDALLHQPVLREPMLHPTPDALRIMQNPAALQVEENETQT